MLYLSKKQITTINRLTLSSHGGNFVPPYNLLNEPALDYLVDAVFAEIFEQPLYPSIHDKAGLYMFNIIANHIFSDGNKRTGLEAGLLFLKLNGYQLNSQINDEILTDFILSVASGNQALETVQNWLKLNSVKK
ncbi:MAG: type II toxin-antitoxin system death-on-curing family toxin [Mucilaginibacter sp.]|uniref:type II toxin-antitoxin system death-on-curing family toxin n=1 Tax=Mucilaginibacter sp. TaxID=1882438 RepID=UPI0034E5D2E1